MFYPTLHDISEKVHESQIMVAVIFGMFLQFFLGAKKTARIAMTIIASSIFVAMYVVSPALEALNISDSSKIAASAYALSSLISIEIISLSMIVMPQVAKDWILATLKVDPKDLSK